MKLQYMIMPYGCQMNEHDAEVLAGMLHDLGYSETTDEAAADLIILVTCAVREHAEQRVYGKIGELYRLKQLNPNLVLAVGGCMPQQPEVANKLKQRFPHLDIIFGTHNLAEFPALLQAARESQETVLQIWDQEGEVQENLPRLRHDGLKAWVTIMYGCNNFCTYCIVPYVRGRERSRRPESIAAEVRQLAERGYREVTLLGQNVNSYGKDLDSEVDFADLLRLVNETGIERIRFTTSHPKDISPRLIQAMAECEHVMEHLHLPVQAGSTRILRAMNRGYSREQYLDLVRQVRAAIPDVTLTTDIIVGFPGETDEDFQETISLLEEVRYDSAFTFAYSPRGGTPAARMTNQVEPTVSKERLTCLIATQNRISLERNQELVGSVQELLVEGPSKNNPEMLTGRTRGNKLVHFRGPADLRGEIVSVRIDAAQTWNLFGSLVAGQEKQG
ncbi:MAG: tRNA (N6-isopentenyl adenosine(37)-C2)-methylthiotransferase MiaB [Bacillota bacterium]|jgi:tRNA-2-methylthio-N6-dimethylallyladenosine synthase